MFDPQQIELVGKILTAIVWVFLIIGVGAACRVAKVITETSEKSIMQLVLLVLYPCFILSKIPGNESLQRFSNVAISLGCGAGLTLVGLGVAYFLGRLLLRPSSKRSNEKDSTGKSSTLDQAKERGTFSLAAAIQNYGFIPIPLLEALFPDVAKEAIGVLFVHNLGLELVLWTVGIIVVSGSSTGAWKRLINGPSVAIIAGLVLNSTGASTWIPSPVGTAMEQLGNCTVPVSLLLVGVSMAGVLMNEKWKWNWRIVAGALATRFVVMPVVILTTAYFVSSFPALSLVLILESAMPSAVIPIVISKHFGGRPAIAVQVFLVTSAFGIIGTPLLLALGIWINGVAT